MNQINDEEAYDLLHDAGFTVLEISRLIQLRRYYTASKLDQIPLKLTDQKEPPCASPAEKIDTLKTNFTNFIYKILLSVFHPYHIIIQFHRNINDK